MSDRLLFVLGRGRSGTSLLSRLLDAHPEIAVAPESLFILYLRRRYLQADFEDPRVVRDFSRDVWMEERMRRWQLEPKVLARRLGALQGADFQRMSTEIYAANAEARGKGRPAWLGDKNPHYALFASTLAETFPRARFIHLVRDYRDNILSYRSVRFDLSSVAALAYRWCRYNRCVQQAADRWPDRFLFLRFEDLIREPRRSLESVCAFLALPFDPGMLEFHRRPNPFVPDWHSNLRNPLDPGQIEKWRRRMLRSHIAVADAVCQPLGTRWGYQPSTAPSSVDALRASPGVAWGWWVTWLERALFVLPLGVRARVIRAYRVLTGNRIR